jgi:lipoate-protein ligase B
VLFLLEHPPTVTLGRRSGEASLLVPAADLVARGIEVHRVARGGDVTYHGPGQLVGYPIIDLKTRGQADVVAFLRRMETLLIEALAEFGIEGYTREGYTGVFAASAASGPPRKIASIGIGVRRWVTFHGFALNVELDLEAFSLIVPCGLQDVRMTAIASERPELAGTGLMERARKAVGEAFLRAYA